MAVTLFMMGCSAAATVPAASGPVASSPQGGVPQEGIKVHGHWTIEVRNADGTVAEVRDFENALDPLGAATLAKVLARNNSVGGWMINLHGNAFQTGNFAIGKILENGGLLAPSGEGFFPTLTIAVPDTGANAGKLVLSGTAIAQFNGNIGMVSTQSNIRPGTEAPSSTYGGGSVFTATSLPAPISLLAGQQVLVTVVISFS